MCLGEGRQRTLRALAHGDTCRPHLRWLRTRHRTSFPTCPQPDFCTGTSTSAERGPNPEPGMCFTRKGAVSKAGLRCLPWTMRGRSVLRAADARIAGCKRGSAATAPCGRWSSNAGALRAPGQTTGTRRKAVVIQATPKRRDAGVESLRWYSRAAGLSSTCVRTRVREASANPNRRLRWVRGCHHDFVAACSHLDSVERLELPELVAGCEECLAVGARWVHLRMCQTCGHIGCCDNSPGRHATGHHAASGHPVIRSAEPGEDWSWCYVDELMFRLRPS